jgi:hypothetical protein
MKLTPHTDFPGLNNLNKEIVHIERGHAHERSEDLISTNKKKKCIRCDKYKTDFIGNLCVECHEDVHAPRMVM